MAYPKLVRNAKTPVRVVVISGEPNEFGERPTLLDKSFFCNYQNSASMRYSKDKQDERITGIAYIDGDILPSLSVISSGYVEIFGEKRDIAKGCKARNLDGSVNYTRLDVI